MTSNIPHQRAPNSTMSQSLNQMTVEGRPISLQPLTVTCRSLKRAICGAYGELDKNIRLGSAISTEAYLLKDALEESKNRRSLRSEGHRIQKANLEAQRDYMVKAEQLTSQDTIATETLSQMGYINGNREAFFPISFKQQVNNRSFSLFFAHPNMASADEEGSIVSAAPSHDVQGQALKSAMIKMNLSEATGVWECTGHSVHEVSDVPAAIRAKEWVLWQDMDDPVEDDEEALD